MRAVGQHHGASSHGRGGRSPRVNAGITPNLQAIQIDRAIGGVQRAVQCGQAGGMRQATRKIQHIGSAIP